MNSDTISRQQAIDTIEKHLKWTTIPDYYPAIFEAESAWLNGLPPVQPDVIRCKDCKWWYKYSDTRGYCRAANHRFLSGHWDINIRRTYDADWYCADAERREQKLQYADEETAQSGLMSAT